MKNKFSTVGCLGHCADLPTTLHLILIRVPSFFFGDSTPPLCHHLSRLGLGLRPSQSVDSNTQTTVINMAMDILYKYGLLILEKNVINNLWRKKEKLQ